MFTEYDYEIEMMKYNAGLKHNLIALYCFSHTNINIDNNKRTMMFNSIISIATSPSILDKKFIVTSVEKEKIPPIDCFYKILKSRFSKMFIYDIMDIDPEELVFMKLNNEIFTKSQFWYTPYGSMKSTFYSLSDKKHAI